MGIAKNFAKTGFNLSILFIALLLFLPSLFLQLSLDEISSFWVIKGNLNEVFVRSLMIQGQSPCYYIILWIITSTFGYSSLVLRLFSLFCGLISTTLVFQLGRLLFSRTVGIYSALCFLCCSQVIESSTSARPYALALTLVLASSVAFIHWCRSHSVKMLIIYGFLLLMTIYTHYLYGAVIIIHLPLIIIHILNIDRNRRLLIFRQITCLIIGLFIALIPSLYHLKILSSKSSAIAFTEFPRFITLLVALVPTDLMILISLLFALYLTIWRRTEKVFFITDSSFFNNVFVANFLLMPPLIIYVACYLLGHSIFIERYYFAKAIGEGLLGGMIFSLIKSKSKQLALASAMVVMTLVVHILFYSSGNSKDEWKSAIGEIRNSSKFSVCPVFFMSGYIESQSVEWYSDKVISDFLHSPIDYYELNNNIILIPYSFDTEETQNYYQSSVRNQIEKLDCFWLLYRNSELFINAKKLEPSPFFLTRQLQSSGFQFKSSASFGLIDLRYFERNSG